MTSGTLLVTARQMADCRQEIEEATGGALAVRYEPPPEGRQQHDRETMRGLLAEASAAVVGDDHIDAYAISESNRLRLVVKWGIGIDSIDVKALAARDIGLRNTPGLFGPEVAEVAMAYLIVLFRRLFDVHERVREGTWHKPLGRSLTGRSLLVVGYGTVGSAVATRAAAFGLRVTVHDPNPEALRAARLAGFGVAALDEGLPDADALVVCCTPLPDNRPLLDAGRLARCRAGAVIVNVARGSLIDEEALARALSAGSIAGAGLDTYAVEPLPAGAAIREAPNVIFGAHNGSYADEAVARANRAVLEILRAEIRDR